MARSPASLAYLLCSTSAFLSLLHAEPLLFRNDVALLSIFLTSSKKLDSDSGVVFSWVLLLTVDTEDMGTLFSCAATAGCLGVPSVLLDQNMSSACCCGGFVEVSVRALEVLDANVFQ